ncbi:MAG: hypothetical protein AAF790_14935 [Planctomycetota bacterium]
MQYSNRLMLTTISAVLLGFCLSLLLELTMAQAILAATPVVLLLGSMFTLYYLARSGTEVDAQSQLKALLLVEFVIVPLGAAAALVAFFWVRANEQGPLL